MKQEGTSVKILNSILPVFLAFAVGGILMLAIGKNPLEAYTIILGKSLFTAKGFGNTLHYAAPLILTGLAIAITFKANIFNMGVEGQLLFGGFFAGVVGAYMQVGSPFLHKLLCFAAGALCGMLFSLLPAVLKAYLHVDEMVVTLTLNYAIVACMLLWLVFSYMAVTRKGNVIVIGLAINMLVPALAGFVLQLMGSANITLTWVNVADLKINIPLIKDVPLLGALLSGHPPITYIAFLFIALMWVLLYRTKLGVYVRVAGENEDAAISLGLKINRYKYIAVFIGALCAALAGINLSLERMALFTNNMTAGRGFIAIAAIYCGQGNPVASALYAMFFGVARALAVNLGLFAGSAAALFDIVPYIVMTIVLTVVSIVKRRNTKVRGFG